ncbi:hypothetical protein ATCC90586_011772 [Pythium insidiosum]|nr:hypothetical protein ATCC90586_011772 [Pythium insidiosum]
MDGAKFDFQTPGVFTYFESGPFKVETYQDRCGLRLNLGDRTPSCYKGAAVAFGTSAVVRLFLENGKIVVATGSDAYQEWLDVQKLQGNTDGYRVFLKADTATYLDVTAASWQGDAYVNVALQVSPLFRRAGAVKGLMGNWDGVQQREESDAASLAKAWQLDLTRNLFTCTGAAVFWRKVSRHTS